MLLTWLKLFHVLSHGALLFSLTGSLVYRVVEVRRSFFFVCSVNEAFVRRFICPHVAFRWAVHISAQYHWRWGEQRENEFEPSILTRYRSVWCWLPEWTDEAQTWAKIIWWNYCSLYSSILLFKAYVITKITFIIYFKTDFYTKELYFYVFYFEKWTHCVFSQICFFYFQIIVERAPRSRAPELDKKKYLVPSDLTGDFTGMNENNGVMCHMVISSSLFSFISSNMKQKNSAWSELTILLYFLPPFDFFFF